MLKKLNNNGFIPLLLFLLLIIVIVIVYAYMRVAHNK